jgi:SAM-dependent methyltransferase
MEAINRLSPEIGYKEAVERYLEDPELRGYVLDPKRADFQFIWNASSQSSVLDIGAGLGAIAATLARSFERVVAVEGVYERARFLRTRGLLDKLDSLQVICADFLSIPLAPAQFDVVVLNGVLEWIGLADQTIPPRDAQIRFLRRVHELLKPSGMLCLGIENRIGWVFLRGAPDHSGLPYTGLMPRAMASAWCRWKKNEYRSDVNVGYRTYTYSLGGYRRLLRMTGFRDVRPYHAWDGYNHPTMLVPLDNREALLAFYRKMGFPGWKGKLRQASVYAGAVTKLWGQLASEFIFLAKKAE